MAKREPTIEQNSHFTAKTKEGQDVEFEATLKFYITPSGQVTLSVPDGQRPKGAATVVVPPVQERSSPRTPGQESPQPKEPKAGRQEVDQSASGTRIQPKKTPSLTDDTIDKAFPRGPEQPSGECTMRQFIPDPCRAVDDAVKSIKGLYNNFFSGPKCPPPGNTDNLNSDYPRYKNYRKDSPEKPAENVDSENINTKERLENEKKYEM